MRQFFLLILIGLVTTSCSKNIESKNTEIEISLAQWSLHKPILSGQLDPFDFPQKAKDLGFSKVEYVSQLFDLDSTLSHHDAVMAVAQVLKHKSDSLDITNGLIMVDQDGLSELDDTDRAHAVQVHKDWIDAAVLLKAPSIRVNLFSLDNPEVWYKASVTSLKELSKYASSHNINVLVENHGGYSSNAALVAKVLTEVNMPNCGTLPDFGNFCIGRRDGDRWVSPCIEEYDMYKGVSELMPFNKGVSAKSFAFDDQGDETKIDYFKMFEIIGSGTLNGPIGIEYEGQDENPDAGILATKALIVKAHLRSLGK